MSLLKIRSGYFISELRTKSTRSPNRSCSETNELSFRLDWFQFKISWRSHKVRLFNKEISNKFVVVHSGATSRPLADTRISSADILNSGNNVPSPNIMWSPVKIPDWKRNVCSACSMRELFAKTLGSRTRGVRVEVRCGRDPNWMPTPPARPWAASVSLKLGEMARICNTRRPQERVENWNS